MEIVGLRPIKHNEKYDRLRYFIVFDFFTYNFCIYFDGLSAILETYEILYILHYMYYNYIKIDLAYSGISIIIFRNKIKTQHITLSYGG